MSRLSYRSDGHIIVPLYLIFTKAGDVRMTRKAPDISRDERELFLEAKLPLSLWDKPTLKASLTVSDAMTSLNTTIDVEAAREALRHVLGVDVDIQVREP